MKQYTLRAFKVDWLDKAARAAEGGAPPVRQESETLREIRLASCLTIIIVAFSILAILLCLVHLYACDRDDLRLVNVMTESGETVNVLIPKGW